MRKVLKWTGIGCGGLFGLFVILVIIVALASSSDNDEPEMSRAESTPTQRSTTPVVSDDLWREAQVASYDELFRNSETYEGKTLRFEGKIVQVIEEKDSRYDFRVSIRHPDGSGTVLLTGYRGPRILEDDAIRFLATGRGVHTYKALLGNSVTVPLLGVIQMDRITDETTEGVGTLTSPGYSLDNPVPAGEVLVGSDGTEIRVLEIVKDARKLVEDENMFNDPPEEGNRFLMVSVSVEYPSGADSLRVSEYDFALVGKSRVAYDSDADCGVIPEGLEGEIFSGGKITGNVCFEIPEEESNLILIHEPGFGSESRRYLALAE